MRNPPPPFVITSKLAPTPLVVFLRFKGFDFCAAFFLTVPLWYCSDRCELHMAIEL